MKFTRQIKFPGLGRAVLLVIMILAITVSGCGTAIAFQAPDIHQIDAAPDGFRTTILDQDGNTIRTIYGSEANRVYVTLDQIPLDVQQAFIAIEDARFYEHKGIDMRGIARAFVNGVVHRNFHQGASTITQQLLKNNVFTGWTEESTFAQRLSRKLQEQYLALRLEKSESKEWILENYLNTINLGGGTYGVQSASRYYFNKDVSDLSLTEATVLAGITKNPSGYNPLTHPEESQKRQTAVAKAMLNQGYIDQEQYDAVLASDIYEKIIGEHVEAERNVYSYFEDALLLQVRDDLMDQYGYSEETAWDLIYRGGLTITSTVDQKFQRICESYAANQDIISNGQEVSVVMLDNQTGAVKAIIGGSGIKSDNLSYNRATDALRQPGSTLKVIGEYAAALEGQYATLGTVYDDCTTAYSNGTELRNAGGSYSGRITIRQAIAKSTNTVAYKVFQNVGMDRVMACLDNFGIASLDDQDKIEALALGGTYHGVSNLDMTAAYHAIANGGIYIKPYYYTTVTDQDGNILLEHHNGGWRSISSETAALLTDAMEDVLTQGTGTAASFSGIPLAGKSGTTTDQRDLWFVGYSPYFTCGVWGGYDDNSPQDNSKYVKTLWKGIMQEAHSNYLYKDFPSNEELESVLICTKCGNRAIDGVCADTLQGNMTKQELFLAGTAPFAYCDCHQVVTVCQSSHAIAGNFCRDTDQKVYLLYGTEGTPDADYLIADSTTCTEHTSFWDMVNPWGGTDTTPEDPNGADGWNDPDSDNWNNPDSDTWGEPDHSEKDDIDFNFGDFFNQFWGW